MIKEIIQIDENNLEQIVRYLVEKKLNPIELKNELGTEVSNNTFGTSVLKPSNPLFRRIFVHFSNNKIESVGFFGDFNLDFKQLVQLYGKYRKVYVAHDERFEYFFNEDEKDQGFVLKTFSENEVSREDNWKIKNIEIIF